ncbi:hypothetical protein [Streptomyces sp. JW3]|uniref:hypothetical protein n=1 Tax=Streptomyces sp. JW3 TaxID=3456955 RepID=UPI003FA4CE4F
MPWRAAEPSRLFRTGHPADTPRTEGTGVTRLNAPADTDVSSRERLAVDPVLTPGVRAGLANIADATAPTGHGKLSQSHEVAQVDAGSASTAPYWTCARTRRSGTRTRTPAR